MTRITLPGIGDDTSPVDATAEEESRAPLPLGLETASSYLDREDAIGRISCGGRGMGRASDPAYMTFYVRHAVKPPKNVPDPLLYVNPSLALEKASSPPRITLDQKARVGVSDGDSVERRKSKIRDPGPPSTSCSEIVCSRR